VSGLRGGLLRRLLLLGVALMAAATLLLSPAKAWARMHAHPDGQGQPVLRSLESLRDLDDQSWQLVAYREGPPSGPLRLRIVGYPGKVRLDHPTALEVRAAGGTGNSPT
jgi:hypothetical protein